MMYYPRLMNRRYSIIELVYINIAQYHREIEFTFGNILQIEKDSLFLLVKISVKKTMRLSVDLNGWKFATAAVSKYYNV